MAQKECKRVVKNPLMAILCMSISFLNSIQIIFLVFIFLLCDFNCNNWSNTEYDTNSFWTIAMLSNIKPTHILLHFIMDKNPQENTKNINVTFILTETNALLFELLMTFSQICQSHFWIFEIIKSQSYVCLKSTPKLKNWDLATFQHWSLDSKCKKDSYLLGTQKYCPYLSAIQL